MCWMSVSREELEIWAPFVLLLLDMRRKRKCCKDSFGSAIDVKIIVKTENSRLARRRSLGKKLQKKGMACQSRNQ